MKKYKLFSFTLLFTLLLGFGVKSANAANCASGDLFSSVTGQVCSTTTTATACTPGDLFSSLTGQSCSGTTTSTDNSSAVVQFNNLFKSNFQIGLRGSSDVSALQQFLQAQGYYSGKIDGSYGRITARAVSDFEGDNNLGNTITPTPVPLPPIITCMQRPACLDSTPHCLIAEPVGGWCSTPIPPQPVQVGVISPASGEQWGVGTTQTIRWTPIAGASKVVISLKNNIPGPTGCETMTCQYGGNNRTWLLTIQGVQAPNTGYFSWKVGDFSEEQDTAPQPSSIIPGTYAVIIQGLDANGDSAGFSSSTSNWFNVVSGTSSNTSPVISGVSGPQTLNVNQQGTWTVSASSPNGGNLSYSVNWGDQLAYPMASGSALYQFQQSATFTHIYSQAGNYTPTFTVTNTYNPTTQTSNQFSAQTSLSVNVGNVTVPTQTLSITTQSQLPNGKVGTVPNYNNYQVILGVSGGPANLSTNQYSWLVVSGSLPLGLYLTASDLGEMINGAPTTAGNYNFTLSATVPSTAGVSSGSYTTKQFMMTVYPATTVAQCSLSAQASNINLNNNNGWGFNVTVNAINPPINSNGWTSNFQGYTPVVTAYGTTYHYGDFFVSAGPLQFTARDQVNSNCVTTITVNPPVVSVSPTPTYPLGCSSTAGYSSVDGSSCALPSGCSSTQGYSSVDGSSCGGN